MNFLTRFGLERSRFTIAIMSGLIVFGIALYPNFPKREDPVVVIRTAVVSALFPGMAPERMENLVAVPVERKIRELAEVKDIRTLVTEGSLIVYVDLKDEVGNVNAAWQRLRDKMDDVKPDLPEGTLGPFVNSDFGDVAIATIAITGEGFSYREMKDVAEDFRKKLYQLPGVAKIDLLGTQDERVWLEIDTAKLASVGVQLDALIKDLRAQNIILPSGSIDADGTRVLLETSGDFPNVRAIETMLTRVGTTDSLVRLADLVTVQRGYITPKVKPIYFNGRPAVVLTIVMQPDQDVTQLGGRLRAAARNYEASLPIGYVIDFATLSGGTGAQLRQLRTFKRRADLRRCRCLGHCVPRVARWARCGDDCSICSNVFSHRHARARHCDRAGVNCRNHHCAWSPGRQRRRHRRGHNEPDRPRRAGRRRRARSRTNNMLFRCWYPRSRLSRLSFRCSCCRGRPANTRFRLPRWLRLRSPVHGLPHFTSFPP